MRWVFVTGGVVSGLGKGLTTASLGLLLQDAGLPVTFLKIDPYLNCDAGTLSPHQHGEVFVLADGTECDLDLGNYERFAGVQLDRRSSITTGGVYRAVVERERRGGYEGKTVQMVPHITDQIQHHLVDAACSDGSPSGDRVVLVELGGTVGDIESQVYLEAVRQFCRKHPQRTALVHLALVPELSNGDIKTKPAQHSFGELNRAGLWPDLVICRSRRSLGDEVMDKLRLFSSCTVCHLPDFYCSDCEIAQMLLEQHVPEILGEKLGLELSRTPAGQSRRERISALALATHQNIVHIGLVGKYTSGTDAYRSVLEAIRHAAWHTGVRLQLSMIDSESDPRDVEGYLDVGGVVIPGGFGIRGSDGMLRWLQYARKRNLPCLGLCLGMQMMAIEYARNVCQIVDATSEEFSGKVSGSIIKKVPGLADGQGGEQLRRGQKRVVYRLPVDREHPFHDCVRLERFRHRYALDPDGLPDSLKKCIVGWSDGLPAIFADTSRLFHLGTQFHPEMTSNPLEPHPLFVEFLRAACEFLEK